MKTLIHAGTVITAINDTEIFHNQGVLIEDGIIREVSAWSQFGHNAADEVIHAEGYTLLPGLIDAHIHITGSGDPEERNKMLFLTELSATAALKSTRHAFRHVEMGVTTVRVLGTTDWVDVALRDAINASWFPGPRMLVAGPGITSSLGHMDRRKSLRPDIDINGMGNGAIADSPYEARKRAWENLMRGVDVLKLNATMSQYVAKTGEIICFPELTFESMKAICDVAHGAGRMVAAHCHGGIGIDMALDAGVDTFEHGRFLTDSQLERMAELGRFLVPTLSPEARMVDSDYQYPRSGETGDSQRWMEIATEAMYDTVARAHAHGVQVAAGTDAVMPNVRHGKVAYEMHHMAKAGLSNLEVISSATRIAARACGIGDLIGQIQPGFAADLIVVNGNPAQDLDLLQHEANIRLVMQGGSVTVDRGLQVPVSVS